MFSTISDEEKSKIISNIGAYFNAENTEQHGSIHVHGQRIGIQKIEELKIEVEPLEAKQNLQTAVLTAYHLMTLIFETSPSIKFIASNKGQMWSKNQQPITQVVETTSPPS